MQSPRFYLRSAALKRVLSPTSLLKTWKEKVRSDMQDQFVLDPVQHFDFHVNALSECTKLSQRVLEGAYIPSPSERILVEKSKGLCRQLVIPHVSDALVLQCLSDEMYRQIASKAPTTKSFFEPEDHTFSAGVGDGPYGQFQAWLDFQRSAPRRVGPHAHVINIASRLSELTFFGLYAKVWLLTKYGTPSELLALLQKSRAIWVGNYRLGRLVGGLRPLFVASTLYTDFARMVVLSRNAGARETWRFHTDVSRDLKTFDAVYAALKSPNTSKSTGITHAKYLLLLSALQNKSAPKKKIDDLIRANRLVWRDFFYRRWAREAAGIYRFP